MKIYLVIERPDGTIRKDQLQNGFRYETQTGDKLALVNEEGLPTEASLEQIGNDLVVNLDVNQEAIITDFFAVAAHSTSQGGEVQNDEVNVSLLDPAGSDNLGDALSAATQPDDAFSLMRFSNTKYTGFGSGIGQNNSPTTGGFNTNNFTDGFVGAIPQDLPPEAKADQAEASEDGTVNINLLANDSDPEGGALTLASIEGSTARVVTLSSGATVTRSGNGTVQYEPGESFNSLAVGETAIDTFSYQITDESGNVSESTVSVTVVGENDIPLANPESGTPGVDPGVYDDNTSGSEEDTTPIVGNVLDNDVDPDGDTLIVRQVNGDPDAVNTPIAGNFGTVTINSEGEFSYTIDNANPAVQSLGVGQTAIETFTYQADDGHGGTATASLNITINGENDALVPNPDGGTPGVDYGVYDDNDQVSEEDTAPVIGNVLTNDSDLDGDAIYVSGVNGSSVLVGTPVNGSFGTIVLTNDGSYAYTLNNSNPSVQALGVGQTEIETFTYTANDGNGSTATATLTITINGENDAPVSNPSGGTPGVDPGIYDDSLSISEEISGLATGNLLDNDLDLDGDTLSVSEINGAPELVGTPTSGVYGTITVNPDGSYSYDLENSNPTIQALGVGQSVVETFTYTADDGNGGSAAATLSITINGENDAPTSNPSGGTPGVDPGVYDDTNSLSEETTASVRGNVLANDLDPDGDDLFVSAVQGSDLAVGLSNDGSFGSITINSNGTYDYSLDNSHPTIQALGVGQTEIETFTYTASDGHGGSATATLTITINGENDAPVSNPDGGTPGVDPGIYDDANTVDEDAEAPVTGNLLSNDLDLDGDTLIVTQLDGNPALVGDTLTSTYGDLTVNSNGTYSYDVDSSNPIVQALSVGETLIETFTYTADDQNGGSATATLSITINGENDAPISNPDGGTPGVDFGVYDDSNSVDEDTVAPVTGNVLANDLDPDGDTLTVTAVDTDSEGVGEPVSGSYGDITINQDGSYSYMLNNANPTVQALAVGQSVVETFTYLADDGNGASATATLSITINGENDAPVSNPDGGTPGVDPGIYDDINTVGEDAEAPVTGNLLSNDLDLDGDTLIVTQLDGNPALLGNTLTSTYGDLTVNSNGTYSYDVDSSNPVVQALSVGETLIETFTYTADDQNGGSATATLSITINGENDAPVSNPDGGTPGVDFGVYDDSNSVDEDTVAPVTGNVLANDLDPDGDTLTVTAVNTESEDVGEPVSGSYGEITINQNGSYSYTLNNANPTVQALAVGQSVVETFTYLADDGNGASATATLSITINGENDTPVSNPDGGVPGVDIGIYDDSTTVAEDATDPATGNLLSNDRDPDGDTLTVTHLDGNPVLNDTPVASTYGNLTVNTDGTFSYDVDSSNDIVQALAAGETLIETFTYTADDGNGSSSTAELTVTINGSEDPPEANDDTLAVAEHATVNYNLLSNDSDAESDPLTLTQINGASISVDGTATLGSGAEVTLNSDGTIDYDPNDQFELSLGETAVDSFTYQISDGNGGFDTATATVTINGENDAPVANADYSLGNTPGRPVTFDVTANDTDVDGTIDPTTVDLDPSTPGQTTSLTVAGEGTWSVDNAGIVTFTPDPSLQGQPTPIQYSVLDNNGASATSNGSLTVTYSTFDIWFGNDLSGSVSSTEFAQSRALISGMADLLPFNETNGAKAALFSWAETGAAAVNQSLTADDDLFVDTTLNYSRSFSGGTNIDAAINYGVQQIQASLEAGGEGRSYADQILLILTDASPNDQIVAPKNAIIAAANAAKAAGIMVGFIAIQEAQSTQAALDVLAEAASLDAAGNPILMTAETYAGIDQAQIIDVIAGIAPEHAYNILHQPILAIGDQEIVAENDTVSFNPLANDNHVSNDTLTITEINSLAISPGNSVALTSGAIVTMELDGSLTYNPGTQFLFLDNGDAELDQFEYTVVDESGNSETGFIGITVEGISAVPPVVIDMDGDGVEFNGVEEGIAIDVDGDGVAEQTAWADEDDAVLVYDENSNGNVDGSSEFAFAEYSDDPDATDLEGLAHFDSNGNGLLDSGDDEFSKFKLWQDSDGDGEVSEGEMKSLLEAGIQSISLESDNQSYQAADGDVTVHGVAEVVYLDGSTGVAADAEFNYQEIGIADDESFEVITESGTSIDLNNSLPTEGMVTPPADIVAPPVLTIDDQDLI
ncbi:MAG: Ig-like domain-containing protein [Verrucomicrobiales bacterium]|nr:Ig-like domain-containing protein [Verrucomicrobiales bacterium]